MFADLLWRRQLWISHLYGMPLATFQTFLIAKCLLHLLINRSYGHVTARKACGVYLPCLAKSKFDCVCSCRNSTSKTKVPFSSFNGMRSPETSFTM